MRVRIIALLTAVLCLYTLSPYRPIHASDQQDEGTIKVDATLVNIPVTVSDENGHYIPSLKTGDFELYENNVRQEIAFFSADTVPFSLAIVLDVSGSTQQSVRSIQQAALEFVRNMRPADKVMVVSFSDELQIECDFTSNSARLQRAIENIHSGGSTRLYDAVYATMADELKATTGRKAMVLLTDGEDTTSHISAQESLEAVQESGAIVYVLQYPASSPHGMMAGRRHHNRDPWDPNGGGNSRSQRNGGRDPYGYPQGYPPNRGNYPPNNYPPNGAPSGQGYPPYGQQDPNYPPSGQQDPNYPPSGGRQRRNYPPAGQQDPNYPPYGQSDPNYPPYDQQDPNYPPSGQQDPNYPPSGGRQRRNYPPAGQQDPNYPPYGQQDPNYPPYGQQDPNYPSSGGRQGRNYPPYGQQDPNYPVLRLPGNIVLPFPFPIPRRQPFMLMPQQPGSSQPGSSQLDSTEYLPDNPLLQYVNAQGRNQGNNRGNNNGNGRNARAVTASNYLQVLVDETGGNLYAASMMDDLTGLATKIADELRHVYVLGYYPTIGLEQGGHRSVRVKMVNRTNLKLRYKTGYEAGAPNAQTS